MGVGKLFLKAFVTRVADDFKQRELLPLKLLFFVHASTVFVLYPYLTIHMRELGINVKEAAIMSAVTPVMSIVMPPLAGMVADRIGNFKVLLATLSGAGGGVALLLLLVPAGRVKEAWPARAALELSCSGQQLSLRGADAEGVPCAPLPFPRVGVRAEACGVACDAPQGQDVDAPGLRTFGVTVQRGDNGSTDAFQYTLHPDPGSAKGDEHFRTSARLLRGGRLFLAAEGLLRVHCAGAGGCALQLGMEAADHASPSAGELFAATLTALNQSGNATDADQGYALSNLTDARGEVMPSSCSSVGDEEGGVALGATLPQRGDVPPVQLSGCAAVCLASAARAALCSAAGERELIADPDLTFWLYMSIRVLVGVVSGTSFAMFEGAVIAILREHSADYGLQRIYASVGGMISSPLSGLLIDWASRGKAQVDFRPAFYLYAAMKVASGLLILTINLEFKQPAKNVVLDVMAVLRNVEMTALLVVVFVLGGAWGFIESFLFWMLQDLGGTHTLMGITFTVGGVAGIPLLVLSGPIIDRVGHATVLTVGFLFYSIRLLGYSLIYNPWLCLIFEALESVTSALSFTAAVTYAAKLSTSSTDTSVQGLLGGMYYGVGRGGGSLLGGYMMTWIGTRPTYQVFALVTLVVGAAYFLTHSLYLRKRPGRTSNAICKTKSGFLNARLPPSDKADDKDDGKGKPEARPINAVTQRRYDDKQVEKSGAAPPEEPPGGCRVNLAFEADDAARAKADDKQT